MLEKIKLSLRISHTALDEDIKRNIDTALLELGRVGVKKTDVEDNLIVKCVELYCKYIYDFDRKGEEYFKHFCRLRDSLSLTGEYNE